MSVENRPPRLFIPGPVEVEPEILAELARPMIGHRAPEFAELAGPVHRQLQQFLHTSDPVMLATSSATGVMEAAVRNCVRQKVLCCVNGAFSSRWFKLCQQNSIEATALEFEWGEAVKPEAVARALDEGDFDTVTVVHNETSTGVMSPLAKIAEVVRNQDDVLLLVDAVTSMGAVPIEASDWGLDVVLAGTQKALALPPGLTVFAVSGRALERAAQKEGRGGYIDFVGMVKSYKKDQTPTTPVIPLIYALGKRLAGILEDPVRWYGDHQERAELTRDWARDRFALFAEEGYESVSVTSIENTRGTSIADLNAHLRQNHGMILSNGYGDLKEKTFRIGHMGANDLAAHRELLGAIDGFL
ncbi:MAG: alanine--glyoxylate aminotransferase family protein [Planctomycetota bacterium]